MKFEECIDNVLWDNIIYWIWSHITKCDAFNNIILGI